MDIQEQRLKAYCKNHDYNVIGVYKEDYSAKHFDMKRPEMKKYMNIVESTKEKSMPYYFALGQIQPKS